VKQLSLPDDFIREVLEPYYAPIGAEICESIRVYISLLLLWNSKIALTTITEPSEILRIHFGESLFASKVAEISHGRVADIGTGAGFPGIPIRMVSTEIHLDLVESVGKKATFLAEVVRVLALSKVDIIRCRMENFFPSNKLSFITARALGHYEILLKWASGRLVDDGKIALLLGEREILEIERNSDFTWLSPARIPQSKSKFVLIGCAAAANQIPKYVSRETSEHKDSNHTPRRHNSNH
jgi:16S rRNA (guanine527-N7)-methyltransferase